MDYALDLDTPVRHVATEMERAAPAALSVSELAATYQHPIAGDLSRVKRNEGLRSDREAIEWIITSALDAIKNYVTNGDGTYSLSHPFDKIRFNKKKIYRIEPPVRFGDSFDPMRGRWSEDIRNLSLARGGELDDQLRESMRIAGWLRHHPAVKDERGVIIVGHRRLRIAEELGIEPVVVTMPFGDGEEGDIARIKMAWYSNRGSKPLTQKERQDFTLYLYGRLDWDPEEIARTLEVHPRTVYKDLKDLPVGKSKTGKGKGPGRPRKITPEQEARIIEAYFEDGLTREQICRELFDSPIAHKGRVSSIIAVETGAREERERAGRQRKSTTRTDEPLTHICVCQCGREDEHPGP